jgi:DNA modification methylase
MIELIKDDCLNHLPKIENNSTDFICVDLPYGTTSIEWDNVIPMEKLWPEYWRILKPNGIVCLFGSQPFSSYLINSGLKEFKYELIWNKNKCGSPGLAKYRPMKVHENILIFNKKTGTYNPQMEEGAPYARTSKNPDGFVGKSNSHGYGMKPRKEFSNEGTRYPKSILNISRDFSAQQQVHPTQKPLNLMKWLIKTYTNENETVLDHCMGSGVTGMACKELNRNFIGIEMNEEYFNIAKDRIENTEEPLKNKTIDKFFE